MRVNSRTPRPAAGSQALDGLAIRTGEMPAISRRLGATPRAATATNRPWRS
ncbi:hypothetical protein [Streptomyces spongiae]|uniref:hypothetical protein n=1 Tax=Streptomyces spongiae TaxID=565072 RepID=UPI0018839BAE|nr:hypothetical protein [Streptomyces spongiae]